MSQEEQQQVVSTQWTGIVIQVAALIVSMALAAGYMQSQVGTIKESQQELRAQVKDVRIDTVTTNQNLAVQLQELNSRLSRIEGKLGNGSGR